MKFTTSVSSQHAFNDICPNYATFTLNFIPNFELFHKKI